MDWFRSFPVLFYSWLANHVVMAAVVCVFTVELRVDLKSNGMFARSELCGRSCVGWFRDGPLGWTVVERCAADEQVESGDGRIDVGPHMPLPSCKDCGDPFACFRNGDVRSYFNTRISIIHSPDLSPYRSNQPSRPVDYTSCEAVRFSHGIVTFSPENTTTHATCGFSQHRVRSWG